MNHRTIATAAVLAATLSQSAVAADADGAFAVRGGGRASCETFLAAQRAKNDEFVSLAGWLDGYLTHHNQSQAATFDIAPWQDTTLLLAAVGSICRKDPAQSFHAAVYRLVAGLEGKRMRRSSGFVEARVGDRSVVLYADVVSRIQANLQLRGHYQREPSGTWDDATVSALKHFQQSKGLEPTGLPDQVTLANLL